MTTTKPDAPLEVGEIVGHAGKRAEIAFVPASFKHYKLFVRYLDGSGSAFVWATDLTEAPKEYAVGQVVGWRGERCVVRKLLPSVPEKVVLEIPGQHYLEWVPASELTDPPPLPDHVQQASEEMVAAGFLTDPWGAIFGRGES